MAKDSQRLEQEFIAKARENTGHTVEEWMAIIGAAGLERKPSVILNWLKGDHKLNHLQATFLSGIFLNDGQPVYDYEVLFGRLFEGKAQLLPIYQRLEAGINARLSDVEFAPTRHYVSIEGRKCFACATMTKDRIRVGLDLGDLPFDDYTQKAKSLGAMPNLTHMIEVLSPDDINDNLLDCVQQAYERVHNR